MLEAKNIVSGYGDLSIIHDCSLQIKDGGIACLIGLNGSGKSTLLKTIAGIVKLRKGQVAFGGEDITRLEAHEVLRKGICYLPQGQNSFPLLTVLENLQVGAYTLQDKNKYKEQLKQAFELFPVLEQRQKDVAANLSGGERAMLGIARALMSCPKVMLLDEPSLGLAPNAIDAVYKRLKTINSLGCSMLIVEHNVRKILTAADYAYVLNSGKIKFESKSEVLLNDEKLRSIFLSSFEGGIREKNRGS
jgi:branched-chain amino acid transport system ATP-binding protein